MATKYQKGSFIMIPNKHLLKGELPSVQAVFIWICEHSDSGGECWPSIKTLAAEAGCSERTVDSAIARLIELGILSRINRFKENEQLTNLYQIQLIQAPPSATIAPPPATIAPPLAQPLRTELNPVLTQSNTSESPIREVREVKEDTITRKKTDTSYREVFKLFSKTPQGWWHHRSQIDAAKRLMELKGMGQVTAAMSFYREHAGEDKFIEIFTPYDLEAKWAKMFSYKTKHNL